MKTRTQTPKDCEGRNRISDLYVALLVYEQVFRFQVSVDQVQSVQVLKGQHDLSSVEPSVRLTA